MQFARLSSNAFSAGTAQNGKGGYQPMRMVIVLIMVLAVVLLLASDAR
jgi:hypothetical protein